MKFKDFIDKDIKQFTELKIGLVKKSSKRINELVKKVQNDFDLGSDLITLKEEINKKLGRSKFRFDFCLLENKKIDELKINKDRVKRIKEDFFKISSELAKNQIEVERKLSE